MRTIKTNLYKFNELSESAQQSVIEKLYDINVTDEWYDFAYEDAKIVGCKITGFDLGGAQSIDFEMNEGEYLVACAIVKSWGKESDGYKIAETFISNWDALVEKYSDGKDLERVSEENIYEFDEEAEPLEEEFLNDMKNEYFQMLVNDYEYQTSAEAIKETIEANEYEFTEDGTLV